MAFVVLTVAACRQIAGLHDPVPGTTVTIDRDTIDLAQVPCGASSSVMLTIFNGTSAPITFAITSDLQEITATPATGTISPQDSAQVMVTATAAAVGDPGVPVAGNLLIDTGDPTVGTITVPVSFETSGGVLAADQNTIDFGQVIASTQHDNMVVLSNNGNAPLSVTAGPFATSAFTITSPMMFSLAPSAQQTVGVRFDPPLAQAYMYQLPISVTGASCGGTPTVVVVGVGSTNPVLLDHSTIDFGNVACGAASADSMVTLTNSNASSYPFTATVTTGTANFSAAPPSGTLPASGTATVTVTRAAIPSVMLTGTVTGNLEVVVTGAPNGTTEVPLQYNVSGAYLTTSSTTVNIQATLGTTRTRSVTITNSGDQVANVQVTSSGSSELTAPTSFQVSPGGTATFTVTYYAMNTGTVTADFTLTAATNGCSAPLVIHATGMIDV